MSTKANVHTVTSPADQVRREYGRIPDKLRCDVPRFCPRRPVDPRTASRRGGRPRRASTSAS
ncbi:hypothetical protein C9J85_03680 [Haloferax sp. wsp5]|nr:hypothetical protein C9J85_03680 [Haloferax sp. wsp5]